MPAFRQEALHRRPATEAESSVDTHQALRRLKAYLCGALTLDALIDWAEAVLASGPDEAWLARVAADLANPLLCREQATALVREHLRTQPLTDAAEDEKH